MDLNNKHIPPPSFFSSLFLLKLLKNFLRPKIFIL